MPPDMTPRAWLTLMGAVALLATGLLLGRYTARGDAPPPREVMHQETVYVRQKAETDTVIRTVRQYVDRWQRDTAWRADTVTVRDTVRVLVPQPVLAALDSTVRACSDLTTACERERAAADALHRSLRAEIARLNRARWTDRLVTGAAGVGLGVLLSKVTP